ncbi:MAG: hypothetical protein OXG35_23800 [Acidobacteria bacterium]|nr:hypothetical protein [Acidobacteriota bacterium]
MVEGGLNVAGIGAEEEDLPLFPVLPGLVSPTAVARAPGVNLGGYAGVLLNVHPRVAAVGGVRKPSALDSPISGDPHFRTLSVGEGAAYYAGAEVLLGSLDWFARPAARVGGALAPAGWSELLVSELLVHPAGGAALEIPSFRPQYRLHPTVGGALSVGRRFGVRISVDVLRINGSWIGGTDVGMFAAF